MLRFQCCEPVTWSLLFPGNSHLEQDFLTFTPTIITCSTLLSVAQPWQCHRTLPAKPSVLKWLGGDILGRTLGMCSHPGELQRSMYVFLSPSSSPFPLPLNLWRVCPWLRAACTKHPWVCCIMSVYCWHQCHQKHPTCMWTREQVLCGKRCVGCVDMGWKVEKWVRAKWMKRERGGKLESWNAEQGEMLAWEGRFFEMSCCPFLLSLSSYLWVFRNEAIVHVSPWPPHLGHPSVSGRTSPELWALLGQCKEIICVFLRTRLHGCSCGSVPGFIVTGWSKGSVPFSLLPAFSLFL